MLGPNNTNEPQWRIVVLVAAHNEEAVLAGALRAALAQSRPADAVIVAADNCDDRTVEVARAFREVTVFETNGNRHRKSGALNQAWRYYSSGADLVVCIDADTLLDPNAIEDWEAEFRRDPTLGGCSAKFTMNPQPGMTRWERFLVRLQKNEFSRWTDTALQHDRKTTVLAGTACCLRGDALRQLDNWRSEHDPESAGPWSFRSLVEDFELTYRFRQMGWSTKVSATVRAYTDAMTDLRSLWAQRMKWTTGTIQDLIEFGVNRSTANDWVRQLSGLFTVAIRALWVALTIAAAITHNLSWRPMWLVPPVLFVAENLRDGLRVPNRDRADIVLAATFIPHEFFMTLRCAWFTASWFEVLAGRVTGRTKDRWALQATAEQGRRVVSAVGASEPLLTVAVPTASTTSCGAYRRRRPGTKPGCTRAPLSPSAPKCGRARATRVPPFHCRTGSPAALHHQRQFDVEGGQ